MAELERYDWPGNVRELANLMEGMASLLPPDQTEITETPSMVRRALDKSAPPALHAARAPTELERLTELERRAIAQALTACEGNVARAARALGIARGTLYNKMVRYGIRA
jgi:two-component system response regulator HydG